MIEKLRKLQELRVRPQYYPRCLSSHRLSCTQTIILPLQPFCLVNVLLITQCIKGEPELTDPFNLLLNVKLRML